MSETAAGFAALLDELRRCTGLSQRKLAQFAGVPESTVGDLLRGQWKRIPRWEVVAKVVMAAVERVPPSVPGVSGQRRALLTDLAWWRDQHDRLQRNLEAVTPVDSREPVSFTPPVPGLVIGRADDLRRLRARARVEGSITSVRGWPGVGKSTLLAVLANDQETRRSFPDGVLWAAVSRSTDVHIHLVAWLRQLEASPDPAMPAALLSRQLAATLRPRRALLLVDDVWQTADAQPLLVGGERCAAMLTTRFTEVAVALATTADDVYVLEVLDEAGSMALLQRLAPAVVQRHQADCATLVAELEGLPLALQVAGRLLAAEQERGWGVTDLLAELREGAALLAATAPADRADVANATTPTVAALLARSTSRLSEKDREHFALLAAFAEKPATFDLAALAAVWAVEDPRPGVRVLADRGLLEPIGGGRFMMHALLTMHARDLLAGYGD